MRKYASEIEVIINSIPHAKFVEMKTVRYAIERLLLIIGEAANHVSREFQGEHPNIEWAQIIGLRNILAHEYGEVKMDKIYLAATKNNSCTTRKFKASTSRIMLERLGEP